MIHRFCRAVLLFCVGMFFSNPLWADPLPLEPSGNTLSSVESSASTPSPLLSMPEVVVTANRLEMPASQVANSLTVITAKDIENKQAGTALEALRGAPGLSLHRTGAPGENSSIFIRGADAGHTLLLVDGVPLNNPISTNRGFSNWDQLFLDDIGQIEIIRGPLSTVYGTNATAGVVNIITQKGDRTPKGSFLFEGGAYQTFREVATASSGNETGNIALSVSRFDTQGFSSADKSFGNTVNNPDWNTTASLRFGISPISNLDNNVFVRYVQSRTNVDAAGGAGGDDPNYFLAERQWVVGSQTEWKLLDGGWEQILGISYTNDLLQFTDDFSLYPYSHYERGVFEGQTVQLSWQNNLNLWKGETLITGIQGQQEWGREDDTYGYLGDYGVGPVTTISNTLINQTTTTGSYFIESQTALMDRFFATLGGRLDIVSTFGNQFNYRGGAAAYFIPGLGTKLTTTYGTGFKAPSIYQIYSPYGSTSLQAETSKGWDAGFEQPFLGGTVKVGVTYFQNDFSNLIDFVSTATPPYGQYVNIDKTQTKGWETFVSTKPIRNLELRVDYTYTWAFDVQTGQQLLRRPQDQAGLSAFYQMGGANFGLNAIYAGERPDLSFATYPAVLVALPSYTLVNVLASYKINEHFKLFGRAENLFNQYYEQVWGYGTPGFSLYFGTKISI